MRGIAVIGNLARDTIDGGPPRVGGAPYHAARALRLLGGSSRIVARCAEADRRALVGPLAALGVPFDWLPAPSTTSFELRYTGEEREMTITDTGAPWTLADARAVGRADWVQVGALTRADFPADVLAALARDRRVALDGQALVRPARTGPLVLDADFDPALLRHVTALKLNEQELEALGGEERVAELGVPELLLTQGSTGGVVIARGVRERIPVRPILTSNPTGAGDAFLAGYVWARAAGHRPASAARHARDDGRARARAGFVIALVRTVEGVFELDVENEDVLGEVDVAVDRELLELGLPRLVAAAAGGATVVALVDRRPPLLISGDGGATWREAGGGLPAGLRRRGRPGRPGPRALRRPEPAPPLHRRRPLLALARARAAGHRGARLVYGTLNSPRATVTAEPPTSTDSISSPEPVARA